MKNPMIGGAEWWRFERPFPHVVGTNVYGASVYDGMVKSFRHVLETRSSGRKGRYDAETIPFIEEDKESFSQILNESWFSFLASLFQINVTRDVDGGFHHHHPKSRHGWVHNDFNPGWFVETAKPINLSDRTRCDYQKGSTRFTNMDPIRRIRALTMILFIDNGPWAACDGGYTGLYEHRFQSVDRPSKAVLPVDNSVLIFECTPHSYHSFISNPFKPRNSIILWLHCSAEALKDRWGEGSLIDW